MDGFIFGTKQCREMFISEEDEEHLNPAYEDWTTIDQLLLGWLYNTMTVKVASQVIGCLTSAELWCAVKDLVGASTRNWRKRLGKGLWKNLRDLGEDWALSA